MDPRSSNLLKGDCKGSTISHVTMIMDLSSEIMLDILSRLPIKSIFCCKTICKLWYNLLTSDSLFSNMYHKRSSSNFPCLLLSIGYPVQFLVELKPDDPYPLKSTTALSPKFHLPLPDMINWFINPLLGEYFKVKLPKREKRICVAYAFCFSEVSRQYKVLRSVVSNFDRHPQVSELEVYTLGVDKKWRYVGEAPQPLSITFSKANVNGVVHWMNSGKNDSIYSFNSWTEEVKSLLAPRGLKTPSYKLVLVELGNCLCLCNPNDSEYVDIWWMKEYGIAESWTKTHILKDTIQPNTRWDRFIPISTWKDGEILMQRYSGTQVVSYSPKEKKFTKVKVYPGHAAASYIPSFYSLKTVIGESSQVSYNFGGSIPPGMDNYNFELLIIWKDGKILIQSHTKLASYNPEKEEAQGVTTMDAQSSKLFNGDCEGGRISHVTRIMDLQIVIMVNILSRLPIKSIFRCKVVCELWYHLLTSDPLFGKMHYKRSSYFPSIFLSINDSVRLLVELKDDVTHP
ncbi:hypothetical protein H5410_025200 [Solanum commersonii]|uniref:F-box domain-containing protein n=1 Tax=Solanum commersonii TaxID=4109 RepID=A0A9J5YXA1_SOLCO|nr:hypothetical protein H5410_025200 [Solanum commersonii]